MNINNQYENWAKRLKEAGWTFLNLKLGLDNERELWFKERLGDPVDSDDWTIPPKTGQWEWTGGEEYVIRDPKMALLAKLTWGGS